MEENEIQVDITEENDVEEVEETPEEESTDKPADEPEESDDSEEEIDWKERALKAEKAIEAAKKKAKEAKKDTPKSEANSEDTDRLRLEVRGVMEKEDQDYVLKYAKAEGISPIEALSEEFIKDKLAYFTKQRTQKAATSAPSGRTSSGSGNVDALVRKFQKDGSLPDDPAMVRKIFNKLHQE
jgi:hypothetical protein